jgi:hypothetical protein
MSLVAEDGTGVVTANAYATVVEIDAILTTNIHSGWGVLDPTSKENLIIWATRILDERMRWFGHKTHQTSGLAWPRYGVKDKEQFLIDDNVVPKAVKVAVAVLADHLIAGNPDAVNSASNLKELKVDVVQLNFDPNLTVAKYPVELTLILDGLGYGSWGRSGPKRIIKH